MQRVVLVVSSAILALAGTACDAADDCPPGAEFSPHFGQCIGKEAPEPAPTTPAPTTPAPTTPAPTTPAPTDAATTGDTAE